MKSIYHALIIEASAEKVYNAITTQEGLSAWWTPDTKAKPELDSIARFAFGPDYFKEMKITELKPSSLVKWTCMAGADEWIGTTISFGLEPVNKKSHPEMTDQIRQQSSDKGTVVILRHEGWKDQTPMFAECNYTWGRFLRSLKLLCETGKGTPWPNQHRIS